MGQKVNPKGLRVGVINDWEVRWFANKKDFAGFIVEDEKIRCFLKKKLYAAGISKIEIERAATRTTVNIHTGKPGVVIGKGGAGIEQLKKDLAKLVKKDININIIEVRNQDLDAQLVAENIAQQLEKRISFRRAMKQAIGRTMRAGAKGIKAQVGGRLGGADIARSEHYHDGSIPLQTIRADIDYGVAEAMTQYGLLGVKVWIYKGEVLGKPMSNTKRDQKKAAPEGGRRHVNA